MSGSRTASIFERYYFLFFCCFILAGIVFVSRSKLEKVTSEGPRMIRVASSPLFRVTKSFTLGYHFALADIFWIRTLRAFSRGITPADGERLARTLNGITELDPFFYRAYTRGGLYLSVFAREPEPAVRLLQEGFRNLSHRWEIPFTIGYIYFHEMRDPESAGKWFEVSARIPDRPAWLPGLCERTLGQSDDSGLGGEVITRMQEIVSEERLNTYWREQTGDHTPNEKGQPAGGNV